MARIGRWCGGPPESIFDPCVNLASAQRVLVDCYKRAAKLHGAGQNALYAAFSCYNTGNLTSGFRNGYVGKVIAGAGLAVPAIVKEGGASANPDPKTSSAPPRKPSKPDAFQKPRNDAFAAPRKDAFEPRTDAVFGRPVPTPASRLTAQ